MANLTNFLATQFDYLTFVYGLIYVILAMTCVALHRRGDIAMPWGLLAGYAVARGLHEWGRSIAHCFSWPETILWIDTIPLMVSSMCLAEAGCRAYFSPAIARAARCLYGLVSVGLLALALAGNVAMAEAYVRLGIDLPACLVVAMAFGRAAGADAVHSRSLKIAAWGFLLLGLTAVASANAAPILLSAWLNQERFLATTGFPIQTLRMLLAAVVFGAAWCYYRAAVGMACSGQYSAERRRLQWQLFLGLGSILALGWWITDRVGENENGDRRTRLQQLADTGSVVINPKRIRGLTGTAKDLTSPDFEHILQECRRIAESYPSAECVYLLGQRDGRAFYYLDAMPGFERLNAPTAAARAIVPPENDHGACPDIGPSLPFDGVPEAIAEVFSTGRSQVVGPYANHHGRVVSAFAPIFESNSNRVVASMGIDVDAVDIARAVARRRIDPIILTLLACTFFLFFTMTRQRDLEARHLLIVALDREKTVSSRLAITAEQLTEASHRAMAASQAKSDFLANMSHEIRTPMTAILGFADQLNEPSLSPAERSEAVETIRRNGEHLLEIINNILDLSKIEAGKMVIENVLCSPIEIVGVTSGLMRLRIESRGLAFFMEADGPLPETIHADPTRLRQILVNLLDNAAKFTHSGSVTLRVGYIAVPKPLLLIDVLDTGIGMTADQVATVFEPFVQADTSTTRRFGGTGMGLAISRRLAQLLRGDLRIVAKQPGEGTCFRLTLPAQNAGPLREIRAEQWSAATSPATGGAMAAKSAAPSRSAAPVRLRGRVLVAEDGPDNQRIIVFFLRKAGVDDVVVVENGALAVEKVFQTDAGAAAFDLILMDMQMPVLDGYEATQSLRTRGYTGPIVALTAHAMATDRQRCLDAGCNDYATKPIQREEFLALLSRFLRPVEATENAGTSSSGSIAS